VVLSLRKFSKYHIDMEVQESGKKKWMPMS
jgi:hypothetical protein